MKDELIIDGEVYIKKTNHSGKRHVVVVDRGWIFAGDLVEKDERIYLHDAVWLFRWESIGFAKAIEEWKSEKVQIRSVSTIVDIPLASEIFRLPVADDWGKK